MKKIVFDVEELRNLIEVQKLTQDDVASRLGMSVCVVRRNCRKHGIQTQRSGPRSGEGHPDWKGGVRTVGWYRYIYSPDHPNKTNQNGVAEHRLVMERHIGRYLRKEEAVHHVNGDTLDNRIENLELYSSNGQHLAKDLKGRCPKWSEEGKQKILSATKRRDNSYLQKRRIYVDGERLHQLIAENKLIKMEIAAELGISVNTLDRYLKLHNIRLNWKSRRSRLQNANRKK